MIILKLPDAQLDLPSLADKALQGEEVAIEVGERKLRQHALVAGALPMPHRDPFDRLLAAQGIVEGYSGLSSDRAFDGLGVDRTW